MILLYLLYIWTIIGNFLNKYNFELEQRIFVTNYNLDWNVKKLAVEIQNYNV